MGSRLAAAAVLLGLATVAAAQPAGMSPGYAAVVRRYAGGDRDGAVAAVARLSERELRDELEALRFLARWARECKVCPATVTWRHAPVPAALVLHTDCSRRRPRDAATRLHESMATALAELLQGDPERAAFARRWYGVMAGLAVDENRFEDGLRWTARGLAAFPGAAELLVAQAAVEETESLEDVPGLTELADPSARQTRLNLARAREWRAHLERARAALRAAVAAQPSLDEAWLRLGRVAWRLDDPKAARAALDELLGRVPARETAYLAQLFAGRLHEDAGRVEEAVRAYDAALALVPDSQAARIALSHARLRLGDAASARREIETALSPAGRRPHPDPFWNYPWGPAVGVEERLEALRREASS